MTFNPQIAFDSLSEKAAELFKLIASNAEPVDPNQPKGEQVYETFVEENSDDFEAAEELVMAELCGWDPGTEDLLFIEEDSGNKNLPSWTNN